MNLKILGILPHSIGGRLTISSIFDGFVQNGHSIKIVDVLKNDTLPLSDFDYIMGYGFSGIKYNIENKLNLKTINYFSDIIEASTAGSGYDLYRNELYKGENYSFYWDRALCEKSDYKNLFYMPHFVNTEIYKNLNLEKEFDVNFAGRLDTDFRLNSFLKLLKTLPDLKFAWYAIDKHYKDAIERVQTEDKFLIENCYQGFIDNEEDMNIALNKSKLVVNFNSQGETSLNYRTFQALACETLVLSDEREELDLFDNLVPTYSTIENLIDTIKFYSTRDNSKITKTCREIIVKNHSSKVCVEKMLKLINHE